MTDSPGNKRLCYARHRSVIHLGFYIIINIGETLAGIGVIMVHPGGFPWTEIRRGIFAFLGPIIYIYIFIYYRETGFYQRRTRLMRNIELLDVNPPRRTSSSRKLTVGYTRVCRSFAVDSYEYYERVSKRSISTR